MTLFKTKKVHCALSFHCFHMTGVCGMQDLSDGLTCTITN